MRGINNWVVVVWAVFVAAMIFYPPYERVGSGGVSWLAGYDWLFWPEESSAPLRLAVTHLLFQIAAVSVLAGAVLYVRRNERIQE